MQLQYFRGDAPNFGDELNTWLWPRLLPSFLDEDASILFIGIGSTIGTHYDPHAKKIVFGTGFVPTYHDAPNVHSGDWDIFFVRGPRTARALGISEQLAIGDSAILIRAVAPERPASPDSVAFMPHWQSLSFGAWEKVCESAGITLIDPREPVEKVLAAVLRSKLLIAEAMHGAIVADALRVPWIPLLPINSFHRDKWLDWAEALDIDLRPYRLWPSNLTELDIALARRSNLNKLSARVSASPLRPLADQALVHIAAQRLHAISRKTPVLSDDNVISSATNQMLDKLVLLKRLYQKRVQNV